MCFYLYNELIAHFLAYQFTSHAKRKPVDCAVCAEAATSHDGAPDSCFIVHLNHAVVTEPVRADRRVSCQHHGDGGKSCRSIVHVGGAGAVDGRRARRQRVFPAARRLPEKNGHVLYRAGGQRGKQALRLCRKKKGQAVFARKHCRTCMKQQMTPGIGQRRPPQAGTGKNEFPAAMDRMIFR